MSQTEEFPFNRTRSGDESVAVSEDGSSTESRRVGPDNLIIRASAGTGKTYQLSNRYLQLVLSGNAPERILATTFTRKAAGEILERILYRLAVAARSPQDTAQLATQLGMPELAWDDCRRVLRRLTSELHRLRVSTLDSFFLQVAQTLSLELGLPPSWQILDQSDSVRLRHEALAALLDEMDQEAVVSLVHWLAKGEVRRGVYQLLSDTIGNMYDIYLSSPPEAWQQLKHLPKLSADELAVTVERLMNYPLPPGKVQLAKGVEASRLALQSDDWLGFLSKGAGKSIADGKAKYGNVVLPADLVDLLEPLVKHARAETVNRLAEQTEATYQLLDRFHGYYESQKLDRRGLCFADLTRYLVKAQQGPTWKRLAFRLDAAIDSLLLDEFQDTSLEQWEVIRPFARHAAQREWGRSLLCVGDTKQAIYGWRGGNAELLEALHTDLFSEVTHQQLDMSYRSAPVIMEVVNQIHRGLVQHTNLGESETTVRAWAESFPEHRTARGELPGWVSVETTGVSGESGIDAVRRDATRRAAQRVQEIRSRAPHLSIAVLVRKNAMVGQVIYELQRLGIRASEEGGNPLTDAATVQLIVSRLILAEHPEDSGARYHLARSPWASALGLRSFRDEEGARRLGRQTLRQLADEGFGATVASWSEQLWPFANERERRRLRQLVELADTFQVALDQPKTVGHERQVRVPWGTTRFVERINEERVRDPSDDPVRVMTVHQSKGLQFDVVILPDLEDRLSGQTPHCVASRNHPMFPIDIVCRYVKKELRPLFPTAIQKAFEFHLQQEVREDLCVLYVALTRAVHSLQLIISADVGEQSDEDSNRSVEQGEPDVCDDSASVSSQGRSNQNKRTIAGLIRAALLGDVRLPAASVVFQRGDKDWLDRLGKPVPGRQAVVTSEVEASSHGGVASEYSSREIRGVAGGRSRQQLQLDFDGERSVSGVSEGGNREDGPTVLNSSRTDPTPSTYDRGRSSAKLVRFRSSVELPGRGVTRVRPSSLEGGRDAKMRLKERLPMLQRSSLAVGELVHAYLERVGWLEDGLPNEAVWREIAQALQADAGLIQSAREFLEQALAKPSLRQLLSRDHYVRAFCREGVCSSGGAAQPGDGWSLDVRREQPVLVWQGQGFLSGSIDRLVLLTKDGQPVQAEIVDFKTDRVEGEQGMRIRAEFYRPQMQAYLRGLERMLRISAERISARIVFLATGENVLIGDADQ